MKRKSNGMVIGTILVMLIGALIFFQAQNQEPDEDEDMLPAPAGEHTDDRAAPNVNDRLDAPVNRGPMLAPPQ